MHWKRTARWVLGSLVVVVAIAIPLVVGAGASTVEAGPVVEERTTSPGQEAVTTLAFVVPMGLVLWACRTRGVDDGDSAAGPVTSEVGNAG